jgi:hypothetical protein
VHAFEANPNSITVTWIDFYRKSVDVISDVICPSCFIGKRRLEKAVA